jgi:hypothetical protein
MKSLSIKQPWASQEEKDFEYSIMDECYEEERKFNEKNKQKSDRILKVLRKIKGEEWYSELIDYSKEAETHNPFNIVRKPKGQYQEESDYELLGGVWVEQSTSYPCEDCYYGTVTVKIDEKRWLEMPFSS